MTARVTVEGSKKSSWKLSLVILSKEMDVAETHCTAAPWAMAAVQPFKDTETEAVGKQLLSELQLRWVVNCSMAHHGEVARCVWVDWGCSAVGIGGRRGIFSLCWAQAFMQLYHMGTGRWGHLLSNMQDSAKLETRQNANKAVGLVSLKHSLRLETPP